MATRLFVGGLSWDTTDDKLREFFSQVGSVVSATVIKDRFTGKSKGFGFVEMSSDQEAQEAIQKLNGQTLDGRSVAVNEARPQAPREGRFGDNSSSRGDQRDRRGYRGKRRY